MSGATAAYKLGDRACSHRRMLTEEVRIGIF